MSASPQALSLAQYAIMSNNPLVTAITFSLIDNGCVLGDIPLINKKVLKASGVRWTGNLPTVNWRSLNGGTTVTTGTPSPYEEQAFILSNAIDTDRVLVEDENQIGDPRKQMLAAYLKAAAYDLNNKFINNDPVAGDPNAIVGIKYRVTNGNVYGVRPENSINANSLDISQTGSTQATANKFLELLDQLLWSVGSPEGTGVVIYVNDITKRRLAFLARLMGTQGGFASVRDQIGRDIMTYKAAMIRDIGYTADQATRIISNTETAAGLPTGGAFTSMYAVHYGMDALMGWQMNPLGAQDLGLLGNDGTVFRTLIEYVMGLWPTSNRCMARIFGLKLA